MTRTLTLLIALAASLAMAGCTKQSVPSGTAIAASPTSANTTVVAPPATPAAAPESGAAGAPNAPPPISATAHLARFTLTGATSVADMTQIAVALKQQPGVTDVGTSFQDQQVLVVYEPARTAPARIAAAIAQVPAFSGDAKPFKATLLDDRPRTAGK